MPVYEYLCEECGPFEEMRPMRESGLPAGCPTCSGAAARAILTAVATARMDASKRHAYATNERSQHSPKLASLHQGEGCVTRVGGRQSGARATSGGAAPRVRPGTRPWMIGH